MKISIITATYNSAATLRDTLDSVLSQTYTDYEVLIQDGGSVDGTLGIVREYESRFGGKLKWVSEKDDGLYDAMNRGIRRATGDVIGILNSDDFYYDSSVLQTIYDTFEATDSDAVFADLVYVSAKNTDKIKRIWKGSPYVPGCFRYGWVPAHPTFYVKTECFEKYGMFDTTFQVSADFELMIRFIERHKIKTEYIPRILLRMRSGGESNGSLINIIKGNKNILRAFRKNGIEAPKLYPVYRLLPKVWNLLKHKIKK